MGGPKLPHIYGFFDKLLTCVFTEKALKKKLVIVVDKLAIQPVHKSSYKHISFGWGNHNFVGLFCIRFITKK